MCRLLLKQKFSFFRREKGLKYVALHTNKHHTGNRVEPLPKWHLFTKPSFSHAQQSLIVCHSQSMHETQEEQEETQVLQVCLGLGRFGHAFASKELDPYLVDKISNYSINSQGRADK